MKNSRGDIDIARTESNTAATKPSIRGRLATEYRVNSLFYSTMRTQSRTTITHGIPAGIAPRRRRLRRQVRRDRVSVGTQASSTERNNARDLVAHATGSALCIPGGTKHVKRADSCVMDCDFVAVDRVLCAITLKKFLTCHNVGVRFCSERW